MRHRTITGTFGRNPSHRKMLFKMLVTSLIERGRITTTLPRAKAIRPLVDKVIGFAKDGSLNAKKAARRVILKKEAFQRLFGEIRTDFGALSNPGGYSRILKWKRRKGDNAPMVLMELLNFKLKADTDKSLKGEKKGQKQEVIAKGKKVDESIPQPVSRSKKKAEKFKKF